MNPITELARDQTRRQFFGTSRYGIGAAALASLLGSSATAADKPATGNRGLPGLPHFAPKAKRAIYLFMAGAPAQIDLLDHKPKLNDLFDTDLPDSIRKGQRLTTMTSGQKRFPIAPSKFKFTKHGESGAEISELLPYTAKMVDDIALIRSVNTEAINHDPAITYINTGHQLPGKASLGAWLSYGLGSDNDSLPSFVVLTPRWSGRRDAQALYNRLWAAGSSPASIRVSGCGPRAIRSSTCRTRTACHPQRDSGC